MISGDVTLSAPGTASDAPPEPESAPETLAACTTRAETLRYLCAKHAAHYTRSIPAPGVVRLTLHKADGDAVAGNGADTGAALADLLAKLGEA